MNSRNVWAVGESLNTNGIVFSNLVEHWDGLNWQIARSPNVVGRENVLYAASAVSPDDIWAVGYTDTISGPHQFNPLTLHWDGTAWMIVPTPATPGAQLWAVNALGSDDVWAVGEVEVFGHVITATTYILHWDGTSWSVVPSPNGSAAVSALTGVSAVASNDTWAVGFTGTSFSDNGALALHWDGVAWTIVPTAATSGADPLYAVLAVTSHNVWAVGSLDGVPLTERWNGTAWSTVMVIFVGFHVFSLVDRCGLMSMLLRSSTFDGSEKLKTS